MKIASHGGDIGKYKILLDEVGSTQTYALDLIRTGKINHGTVISCLHQSEGRGRMDKNWNSDKSRNLTASFILNELQTISGLLPGHLSMIAALSVTHAIKTFIQDPIRIKWPNDIICNSKKLAGILITNQWRGSTLESSVLGIGININQTQFDLAPQAGSIKMIISSDLNQDKVMQALIEQLNHWYGILLKSDLQLIRQEYHQSLYGYGYMIDVLMAKENKMNRAEVLEVLPDGKIKLEFMDKTNGIFDLDEIKIIF